MKVYVVMHDNDPEDVYLEDVWDSLDAAQRAHPGKWTSSPEGGEWWTTTHTIYEHEVKAASPSP